MLFQSLLLLQPSPSQPQASRHLCPESPPNPQCSLSTKPRRGPGLISALRVWTCPAARSPEKGSVVNCPLYQGGWRSPERLDNLPKVTQLVREGSASFLSDVVHLRHQPLPPFLVNSRPSTSGRRTPPGQGPLLPGGKSSLEVCALLEAPPLNLTDSGFESYTGSNSAPGAWEARLSAKPARSEGFQRPGPGQQAPHGCPVGTPPPRTLGHHRAFLTGAGSPGSPLPGPVA